jgi:hypothetical protein
MSHATPTVARGTLVLTSGTDRHQSIMDVRRRAAHSLPRRLKGPEWRTPSAASSMRFPDWYGLRSQTGASTSLINAGANTPALAFPRGPEDVTGAHSPGALRPLL